MDMIWISAAGAYVAGLLLLPVAMRLHGKLAEADVILFAAVIWPVALLLGLCLALWDAGLAYVRLVGHR